MNWLAKIINGDADEFAHAKLMKYGLGTHPGPRAKIAISSNRIAFKADLDLEKVFLRAYLFGAPRGSQKLKGVLRTYSNRKSEFAAARLPIDWKESKGKGATTYAAKINEILPLEDINELLHLDDPTTFYLFSISPRENPGPWKITTKTSFPKSGSSDEEDEKEPTFTKGALANTPEVYDFMIQEILPDFADKITSKTKKISIYNMIEIQDIQIPDEPKMSFAEKRKQAKKKGKIQRRVMIDDKEYSDEADFLV